MAKYPKPLKPHKLNLDEALRLAAILDKYADTKKIDAIEFVEVIMNKIPSSEYLNSVKLLLKTDENEIDKQLPLNVLTAFIEGLKLNKVVSLIEFYRSLIR